ncbi:MAG: hypothetical protein DRJ42_25895 [Deltaproteobacteria bacterium]|nr:MAG: hypothetical protein DRJ42_25895 [Deltaproteobacteria bacterium]
MPLERALAVRTMAAMERFQNILVATDFSEASELAVGAAPLIEGGAGKRVTLLHVVNTPELDPGVVEQEAEGSQDLETAVHDHLNRLRSSFLEHIEDVKTAVIRSSNPANTICEFAADQGVDLILLGTTGRAGLARFLIGSVAERVVRHAPCPVMVLREKKAQTPLAP